MKNCSFGFGCMRLPLLSAEVQSSFDYERITELFDAFLERGFTYFDTAYTYHGYKGEQAVREALVKRRPRESFELATKLPLRDFRDAEDMEKIFAEQLASCGVEYFDYYLLHNMGTNVYEKCVKYDAFGFVRRMKEEGRVRRTGMSFHDSPELLERIMSRHAGDIDFLQLQINYADWEQPNVQSRRCLEIANKYGKPVTVMEPCKGGTLARLPAEAEELLRGYDADASPASWAMRFAGSQPGVERVLSGMNSMEQLLDNTAVFRDFRPLSAEETALLDEVRQIIERSTAVRCTACGYCTHGCPQDIPIPEYFALYNSAMRTTANFSSQMVYYNNASIGRGKAGDCVACRQCESACPQHLPVVEYLRAVAEKFEKNSIIPQRE